MKQAARRLLGAAFRRRANSVRSASYSFLRTIHIVWIGDESKRPENCIDSWRQKNPGWTVRVWGNRELTSLEWENHKHMSDMLSRQVWDGVADMMRWEILDKYGGFAVDADSISVRPLEDWLFEPRVFSCWENEIARPGLIANGYFYSHPGNALVRQIIRDIYDLPEMAGLPFRLTGPLRLTNTFHQMRYNELTIYPSHYFIPTHFAGLKYEGNGPIFAQQLWHSTKRRAREGRLSENKNAES